MASASRGVSISGSTARQAASNAEFCTAGAASAGTGAALNRSLCGWRATLESLEAERLARQPQSDLFAAPHTPAEPTPVVEESAFEAAWRALDPDMLSPREALDALYRLKTLKTPNQDKQ